MSATTMLKTALTLLVLMLSPELHAEDSDDALVLRTLEAQLAFDLPPSELRDFPWGQVLEAEMWHAHARNNPGATSGRCHAAKPLRRASSLSIAGPSAMATVDCGDGLNIGVPIIDELPSHLRILSKGHLQFKLKDFGAQCFRVKRAAIRPGPTEVLVRGAASVWFEGDDSNTQNTQHWSALPWPDGAADARLCALPTSLELDLFFAMRKVTVDAPISLKPGARLLRAFLQADRDKAQKILEEVEADSVDDTFNWVRRAVGQKWPALILEPIPVVFGCELQTATVARRKTGATDAILAVAVCQREHAEIPEALFVFDPATQLWKTYIVGAPVFAQTLLSLDISDSVSIRRR